MTESIQYQDMDRRFICFILLRMLLQETMARYKIHAKKYLMVLSRYYIHSIAVQTHVLLHRLSVMTSIVFHNHALVIRRTGSNLLFDLGLSTCDKISVVKSTRSEVSSVCEDMDCYRYQHQHLSRAAHLPGRLGQTTE